MSNKVVYISDFYYPQVIGGGEVNDHELIKILKNKVLEVETVFSSDVDLKFLEKNFNSFYIISNFVFLKKEAMSFLTKKCSYVIYEHDHKYLKNRNPAAYPNLIAPRSEIVNEDFYKNAKKVLCQSLFHKSILEKNLKSKNVVNLSGNLWSVEALKIMETIQNSRKQKKISILDSHIGHKNTADAETYCILKGLQYEKIKSNDYYRFLELLGKNETFIFLPKTPETLSRIVVEAKIMGVEVMTNNNVGATYENWYRLSPMGILKTMKERREQIVQVIMEEVCEQSF